MIFRTKPRTGGDSPPAQTAPPMGRLMQRRSRLLTALVSAAAISSFAGVIYWAHRQDIKSGGDGIVPLIRADSKPTKTKPDQPGGMVVPDQDKDVYSRLNPNAAPTGPEKLLPPPAAPQIPPATPPASAQQPQVPPPSPQTGQPAAHQPAPGGGEPPKAPDAAAPGVANPPPTVQPGAGNPPAGQPGQSIATLIDSISRYRIQLASVKTEEQAQATFARLQKSHGDVLGSLSLQAKRVDLGERGVFYRVQAGPLDEAAAAAACAKLKSRSVDCLIVKP